MSVPDLRQPTAMPYATQPPKIWANPLKLNQIPVREPCSFFVYHCDVKSAKPGVTCDQFSSKADSDAAFVTHS